MRKSFVFSMSAVSAVFITLFQSVFAPSIDELLSISFLIPSTSSNERSAPTPPLIGARCSASFSLISLIRSSAAMVAREDIRPERERGNDRRISRATPR